MKIKDILKILPTMFMAMTISFAGGTVFAFENTHKSVMAGMPSGDLTVDTAIWGGAFGSLAHQKLSSRSNGYSATASGGLFGLEHCVDDGEVYGLALGISNSNLHESMNYGFVNRILGWHALIYGSNTFASDSYFIEWLATGVLNKNKGTSYILINNQHAGVNSNYSTSQGGIRINLGQATESDNWVFSLLETIIYTFVYQPSYNALNSTAVVQEAPKKYNNIFTLGGGVRLAVNAEDTWLAGTREIHFLGTYDVVTSTQVTTANFLNSVSNFAISSAAGPWAFLVGATYTCTFFDSLQLQLRYDFQLRTKYTDNSGEVTFRYLF